MMQHQQFKNQAFKIILYLFPKNLMSCLMGKLVAISFPKWFVKIQIRNFANWFGIDWEEVKDPIEHFQSLQAFFIRELKPEKRPIHHEEKALISPCDGVYGQAGQIEQGLLLQAKGKSYSLSSLIGDVALASMFNKGSYATFYLSPRDYHRFHAPFSTQVLEALYLPGYLWPVNPWAVANVDQLFCVNERLVCVLQDPQKATPAAMMVAVGATMVGKVRVRFDADLTTNVRANGLIRRQYDQKKFLKGEELGLFEFGSTIILLIHPDAGYLDKNPMFSEIKMGQRIGRLF